MQSVRIEHLLNLITSLKLEIGSETIVEWSRLILVLTHISGRSSFLFFFHRKRNLHEKSVIHTKKMIIPIRCVSCGFPYLSSRWELYQKKVAEYRKKMGQPDEMEYLSKTTVKTAEGKALDDLGIKRMCCRRHMLTHVDLI